MNKVISMFFWLLVVGYFSKVAVTNADDSDSSLSSAKLTDGA